MSNRARMDSLSNYDEFWLADTGRSMQAVDFGLEIGSTKLAPVPPRGSADAAQSAPAGGSGGELNAHIDVGSNMALESGRERQDSLAKSGSALTPALSSHNYLAHSDMSPLVKALSSSDAASGMI